MPDFTCCGRPRSGCTATPTPPRSTRSWSRRSRRDGRRSERKRGEEPGPFFASDDDLLHRVKIPEWQDFVRFLVDSLGETVKQANRDGLGRARSWS